MWFWIAVMAFFLIVFLVSKAVARGQGDLHNVGLQHGHGLRDTGEAGGAGDGWGGGGWDGGGDGAGGDA